MNVKSRHQEVIFTKFAISKQHHLGLSKDTCPLCYTKFSSYINVVKHYRSAHCHGATATDAKLQSSREGNGSKDSGEHAKTGAKCNCVQCRGSTQSSEVINSRVLVKGANCKDCDQFSQSTSLLNLHQKQHELGLSNLTCPLCLQNFSTFSRLETHFKIAHNEGTASQDGSHDSPVAESENNLQQDSEQQSENDEQHDRELHSQFEILHSDNQSGDIFTNTCTQLVAKKQHFSYTSKSKHLITCKQCGQKFRSFTLYSLHEKQHVLGLSSKTCPLCRQIFSNFCNLGSHFKTVHKDKMMTADENSLTDESGNNTEVCSEQRVRIGLSCGQNSDGSANDVVSDSRGNGDIQTHCSILHPCQKCGQVFKKVDTFKMHERQHELGLSNLQCPLCGIKFSTFSNLGKHFKKHRNKVSTWAHNKDSEMNESENCMEDDSEQPQSENGVLDEIKPQPQFETLTPANQSDGIDTNTCSQPVASEQLVDDLSM
ncbi:zinc finger protein ZFP2-like [Ptychodera flava]|uniref:zinc finger protein ZFP2-like n=1 Tax=Ptychodera flava TaxID=63121 RepID=UPI00396A24C3